MDRVDRQQLRDPAEAEHDQGAQHRRLGQRQLCTQAYKELGLDYDKQLASFDTYNVTGTDPVCNAPVNDPEEDGEIWIQGGDIVPFSSPVCTLLGVKKFGAEGKKFNAIYLVDHQLGIKVFADAAFYSVGGQDPKKPDVVPFLLKKDAEAYAPRTAASWRPMPKCSAPSTSDNRAGSWAAWLVRRL
jgi:hypothetical protein